MAKEEYTDNLNDVNQYNTDDFGEKKADSQCQKGCPGCSGHSGSRVETIWYLIALGLIIFFAIILSKIF
ncbi:MAG TPA: hypothetical protein GXX72_04215 [Clostridiaceae bacterium]|nr:hypothetical protein [Clostridiaceae bacterium]